MSFREYIPSLIAISCPWILLGLAFLFASLNLFGFSFGTATAVEEHPCLLFSDGRLAVIRYQDNYDSRFLSVCENHIDTVAWFKSKGYHITAANVQNIYMER